MKPSQYPLYKIFEPGLKKATDNTPCADNKYHKYKETVTHGFGPIKMTLDLYYPDAKKDTALAKVEPTTTQGCCQTCTKAGEEKYYSVDTKHGFCGEACMKPSQYPLYKIFEPGLKKATDNTPCADNKYHKYKETVTHGFGPIKMTLDLYYPDAKKADVQVAAATCKKVDVQENFNQKNFVEGGEWFIHQQMTIKYLPKDQNFCVRARYSYNSKTELAVHNYANVGKVNGKVMDSDQQLKTLGGICGEVTDAKQPAKLLVGPCRLRLLKKFAFGPYWVLAAGGKTSGGQYEYALISGGQPTIPTKNGLCKTGDGTNGSGLWIFTRSQKRDESIINKLRAIAEEKGFDTSVLNDVEQVGCEYAPAEPKASIA